MNDEITRQSNSNGFTGETHPSCSDAEESEDFPRVLIDERRGAGIKQRIAEVKIGERSMKDFGNFPDVGRHELPIQVHHLRDITFDELSYRHDPFAR